MSLLAATVYYRDAEVRLNDPLDVLAFATRVVNDVLTAENPQAASQEAEPLLAVLSQIAESMVSGEILEQGECICGECDEDETWSASSLDGEGRVSGGVISAEIRAVIPEEEGDLLLPYCVPVTTDEGLPAFRLPSTVLVMFDEETWYNVLSSTWSLIGRIIPLFHDTAVDGAPHDVYVTINPAAAEGPDGNYYYKVTFSLIPSEG